jgi:hypothetical protein
MPALPLAFMTPTALFAASALAVAASSPATPGPAAVATAALDPAEIDAIDGTVDSWSLRDIISGVPATGTNTFGDAVAVSGHRIAIGAYNTPCPAPMTGICGDAHVYDYRPGPGLTRYPVPSPDPSAGAAYGVSVAIDGDWLLVGAPGEHRSAGYAAGNVYLFHFVDGNWDPVPLQTPDEAGALLGQSVAVSASGLAVAGMPHQSRTTPPALTNNGAVATFVRDAAGDWSYEGIVRAPTPASNAYFGSAVGLHTYVLPPGFLDGFGIAVGAPGTSVLGQPDAGEGYAFTRGHDDVQWTPAGFFNLGAAAHADARFGAAAAIDGALVAFGSPGRIRIPGAPAAGSVYFARRSGTDWSTYAAYEVYGTQQDGAAFGSSIALQRDDAFVGAPDYAYATGGDGQVLRLHHTAGGPEHWDYVAYLVEYYPTENAHFGTSLALDGFRLAIGSPGSTLFGQPPTSDSVGMAYVYVANSIFADGFDGVE